MARLGNYYIPFSTNIQQYGEKPIAELNYVSNFAKQYSKIDITKPLDATKNGITLRFPDLEKMPNGDMEALNRLKELRCDHGSDTLNDWQTAVSINMTVMVDNVPCYIPDLWIAFQANLSHCPTIWQNCDAFDAVSAYYPKAKKFIAYPLTGNTKQPIYLSISLENPVTMGYFYVKVEVIGTTAATTGTSAFINEIAAKIAGLYQMQTNIVGSKLSDAIDLSGLFVDETIGKTKNLVFAFNESDCLPKSLSMLDAQVQESSVKVCDTTKEFLGVSEMVNKSNTPVSVKTTDFTHKITETHAFVKEHSCETTQTIQVKTTLELPFKILSDKFEVTASLAIKTTDKVADTWTYADEKTYAFSGQTINLQPNTGMKACVSFERGTATGVVNANILIDKVYAKSGQFTANGGNIAWGTYEVNIPHLIERFKLTTIKAVKVDGETKYVIPMTYRFTSDVGSNMVYLFEDKEVK